MSHFGTPCAHDWTLWPANTHDRLRSYRCPCGALKIQVKVSHHRRKDHDGVPYPVRPHWRTVRRVPTVIRWRSSERQGFRLLEAR